MKGTRKVRKGIGVGILCAVYLVFFSLACQQAIGPHLQEELLAKDDAAPAQSGALQGLRSTPQVALSDFSDYEYYKKNYRLSVDNEDLEKNVLRYHTNKEFTLHLLEVLREQVIPQSVDALLKKFPKTFGYLSGKNIGMGLALNSHSKSEVAGFGYQIPLSYNADSIPDASECFLEVSYSPDWMGGDGRLQEHFRKELEGSVAHEMMHAMMFESLTYGMYTMRHSHQVLHSADPFPIWFREGTAAAVNGSARFIWNMMTKKVFMSTMTADKVKEFLTEYPLTGNTSYSTYRTGYLAVLYLSYVACGNQLNPVAMAEGLDAIMSRIHGGASLSEAVKVVSGGKYASLSDFESQFTGNNSSVVDFCVALLNAVKYSQKKANNVESSRGSLLAETWGDNAASDDDLLPDEPLESSLFWLYVRRDLYVNKYGGTIPAAQMFKGGAAYAKGNPGPGTSNAVQP